MMKPLLPLLGICMAINVAHADAPTPLPEEAMKPVPFTSWAFWAGNKLANTLHVEPAYHKVSSFRGVPFTRYEMAIYLLRTIESHRDEIMALPFNGAKERDLLYMMYLDSRPEVDGILGAEKIDFQTLEISQPAAQEEGIEETK